MQHITDLPADKRLNGVTCEERIWTAARLSFVKDVVVAVANGTGGGLVLKTLGIDWQCWGHTHAYAYNLSQVRRPIA